MKWSLGQSHASMWCCKSLAKLNGARVFGVACSRPDINNILATFFLTLLLIEGHDLLVKLQNLLTLILLRKLFILEDV